MKKVLVLCTGNSCRSQMAEAYLKSFAEGGLEVYSAGIEAHGLNPNAVATMAEDGIDISANKSKTIDAFQDQKFDVVLTVCDHAREVCPYYPANSRQLHYSFPDPAIATGTEKVIQQEFRQVRDMIKAYCAALTECLKKD